MKKLFDAAMRFAEDMTLRDLALFKVCLIALGMVMGLALPWRKKRTAAWLSSLAFAGALVPLVCKFIPYLAEEPAAPAREEVPSDL